MIAFKSLKQEFKDLDHEVMEGLHTLNPSLDLFLYLCKSSI
jgi:hypothetical protein